MPFFVRPPAPEITPLKMVELLLPPATKLLLKLTLPPIAPPPPKEPIVSGAPLIVSPTLATLERLIAAKSPIAVPPSSCSMPAVTFRFPRSCSVRNCRAIQLQLALTRSY